MKKLKLLLAFCALMLGWSSASAQNWTGNAPADQKSFYLYNVGAQKFINNGDPKEGWGTNAYLQAGFGMDIKLEASSGAYNLNTNVSNGGDNHYLGTSTWCDGAATPWTFTAVAGQANTYTISNGTSYLVANDALNDVEYKASTGDNKSWWKLVSLDDFKAAMNAKVYSSSEPMDVSVFIQGRSFARNDGRNSSWKTTHAGGNWTWIGGSGNKYYGNESWNNTFDVHQEIEGLPEGIYELKCSGFGTNGTTYIYATTGDATTEKAIQSDNTTSRGTNAAAKWTAIHEDNAFAGQTTGIFVVADGNLTAGIKRTTNKNADWCIWDEFRLYYYGNAEDVSSKITNPNFDSNASGWTGAGSWGNSEVEFYNTTDGFDMYQDISGLDAGIYAVELQGFYRNGAGIDEKRAKAQESLLASIYAKGEDAVERSTSLLSIYEEAGKVTAYGSLFGDIPNWMNQAQDFISAGYYKDNKVIVEVGAGGTLRIGAKKTGGISADWTILDNFSLTKLNYATLADAYAAEWTARKTSAQALLNNGDYSNIVSGSTQRTALSSAVSATPSDLAGYISALADLRNAVNNFKAAKYAYNLYATNAAAATEAYNAEGTTYVNVTGDEKTTFNTAYATNVSGFSPATNNAENYYNAAVAIGSATDAFTNETVKNNYNEYAAEVATATLLGTDVSGVATPTTSSAALTAAHSINVLNYNKVVAEEYEDVSGSTLGAWTDNNVTSRRGQHWDGTTDGSSGTEYFEMNSGWGNTSWNMSRTQNVSLAEGKYILKVAARVSTYANATLSVTVGGNTISTISGHQGDTGKGITTSGVASYDEGTFANENNGRGFEWKYIPFELDETGSVTLSFTAEGHAQYQFVSFTSLALLTDPKVAARTSLLNKINEANTKYNGGANVGAGIFQVPTVAGTTFSGAISVAQGVYDDENADLSDITDATSTLNTAIETYEATELNAPDAEKKYQIVLEYDGWDYDGKAITYIANDRADMGLYNIKYQAAPNANLAQAFTLTHVSGNTYKMSQTDVDGNTRYLCTGTPYSGEAVSIRTTTDVDKALIVKIIATGTANVFNIYNTEADNYIGSQDAGVYTVNSHINFTIAEASQATVDINIASDVKYATRIFPFKPSLPTGVVAYSCEETEGDVLSLEEVAEPVANTPYILYAEGGSTGSVSGWGTAPSTDAKKVGLLTGVYANTSAPVNSYVLQNKNSKVGFYHVAEGKQPTVGAYRCYLTDGENARAAFFFRGDITGVANVEAATEATLKDGKYLENGKIVIVKNGVKYNAAGAKLY